MNMERAQLSITLLSPLHIGCGHDYAPYEYLDLGDEIAVFGTEQLVGAIPAAERHYLVKAANDPNRPDRALGQCVARYKNALLDQPGVRRIPKLAKRLPSGVNIRRIERTSFDPLTDAALLPGSSLKGALRTAWLSAHRELLRVAIPEDPLRLLSIADAPASNESRAIVFLQRPHKKPEHHQPGSPSSVRYDYLLEALQRRGKFQTEIVLKRPARGADLCRPIPSLAELFAAASAHYGEELQQCRRYLADMREYGHGKDWLEWIASEFDHDTKEIRGADGATKKVYTYGGLVKKGKGFVLRLGKHGGAESLTLPGLRKIRTRYGEKSATFTMTLTANDSQRPQAAEPFGWVFVQVTALRTL